MKYNKKGFTLVELLSVIVLIGLLLGIGIPGISRISSNMKKKSLNTKIDLIEQAGVFWGQDNKTRLQSEECDIDGVENGIKCYKISVKELIENDYLSSDEVGVDKVVSPIDNSVISNNYVYVYKKNNRVYAYLSNELSTKLPKYKYVGNNFEFEDPDDYEQYTNFGNEFFYQVSDNCKPDNNWSKFDSYLQEINSDNKIVFVKMKDNKGNEIINIVKKEDGDKFKVCTDKQPTNGWYDNDVNITIVSSDKILYSSNGAISNSAIPSNIEYVSEIKVTGPTKSTKLYVKSGSNYKEYEYKIDTNKPKIEIKKIDYNTDYSVTIEAKLSDEIGLKNYKIVNGNNCNNSALISNTLNSNPTSYNFSTDSTNQIMTNETSAQTYTFCVYDVSGKESKKQITIDPKDFKEPEIDEYKVSYNTSTASATLSAKIKDNVNLAGYLFTTSATCPSDKSSYIPTTGTTQTISKSLGVTEGNYYLCVIDQNNKIKQSEPIYVANCLFGGSYTCSVNTLFGITLSAKYHFYIELANSKPLKVQIETPGSRPEENINFGTNYYDVSNTFKGCDSDGDIRIHIYHNGLECYTEEIRQT